MAWIIVSHTNNHGITKAERRQVEEHWYVFINTRRGLYSSVSAGALPVLPCAASKANHCSQFRFAGCERSVSGEEENRWRKWGGFGDIFRQVGWTQPCRRYSQKHSLVPQSCSQQSQCNGKSPAAEPSIRQVSRPQRRDAGGGGGWEGWVQWGWSSVLPSGGPCCDAATNPAPWPCQPSRVLLPLWVLQCYHPEST